MKNQTKRRAHRLGQTLLFTGLLAAGNVYANEELTPVSFGLDWFAKAEHGGFFQAVATGIYEEHGLDVTIEAGGPQVNGMQLLLAGKLDFVMGYPIRNINAVEQGLPVVSVATTFQKDPQVVIMQPGIETLAELKGGSILVANYADTTFWPWLTKEYGFTEAMKVPFTGSLQPFLSERVDAQQGYLTNEPYTIGEAGVDANVILMADEGYPPYAGVIETTQQMVDDNPEVVRNFIKASLEGLRSYFRNPEPGNKLIRESNPELTPELIAYSISKMNEFELMDGGAAQDAGIGSMTHERWKQTFDFMVATGLVGEDVEYRNAYSLDFLPEQPIFID
jgi:NitT/TauT family transport system substrate-binding protein